MKAVNIFLSIFALCVCGAPAFAGQGFYVTFNTSGNQFPATTIANINFKDWYQDELSLGKSIPADASTKLYTEHCAAFFGCGSNKGDQSLGYDGILWSLNVAANVAVNFCISNHGPISSTCGVTGTPNSSQSTYDNWIAGCVVPGGGYTCQVTHMGQSGDQIAITYTLALPDALKKE
jgi:hypothetical protein